MKRIFQKPIFWVSLCLLLLVGWLATSWAIVLPDNAKASYVGGAKCATCHTQEHETWLGSDHDRAMEHATADAVLGDFNDATFTYQGVTSRMFKKGETFFFHTEGPDGEFRDYEVKYTFGVFPLQQYMVEFPDGRVQVLRVSWDVPNKKWFYVTPPDVLNERILPGDPFHWTGNTQNWNHMCAECHSTNLKKNYDLKTNTYHTTFEEIDVSCEACHGPGSLHVQLAESNSPFWDRKRGYAITALNNPDQPEKQLNACAACHSRRSPIHPTHPGFRPHDRFLNDFAPALLTQPLYHADGQILDEVYVYGSFVQSKMHAEGVRCTDCHEPHSLKLKFEGNKLCAQCHEPGKYEALSHHHHPEGEGRQCINCHMRPKDYMVIDPRRDHSFRVPRPDLSVSLGTPNACQDCHEEPAKWSADWVVQWYGKKRADDPHYAAAFTAARKNEPGADKLLAKVLKNNRANIARATAVQELRNYDTELSRKTRLRALRDNDPLVRMAAVQAFPLGAFSPKKTLALLGPRLRDSRRIVRIAAARQLAELSPELLGVEYSNDFFKALKEYKEANSLAPDRAADHLNMAGLYVAQKKLDKAIIAMRKAIRAEPYLTNMRSQLSTLLARQYVQKRNAGKATQADAVRVTQETNTLMQEEIEVLKRNIKLLPKSAELQFSLGSTYQLIGKRAEAGKAFQKASELDSSIFLYRLRFTEYLLASGQWKAAAKSIDLLFKLRPNAPEVADLRAKLEAFRPPGS